MVTGLSANIYESGMRGGDLMMKSHTAGGKREAAGAQPPQQQAAAVSIGC